MNCGQLSSPSYYFIDMELCDLNLEDYIKRTPELQRVPFMTAELPSRLRMVMIWHIMNDVLNGLVFIHAASCVHRDIKPRNSNNNYRLSPHTLADLIVLYAHTLDAWKIADFGLATACIPGLAQTTYLARGTTGYRAPELLDESRYTNKVDIWAMGCILYEVVTGRKAFDTDQVVRDRSLQKSFSGEGILLPFDPKDPS